MDLENVAEPLANPRTRRLSNYHAPQLSKSNRARKSRTYPVGGTPKESAILASKNHRLSTAARNENGVSSFAQRSAPQRRRGGTPRQPRPFTPKKLSNATPQRRRSSTSHRHGAESPSTQRPQKQLSRAELAHLYSSTIKLCQDNKINARNTWNLNLIDYMTMLVRDDNDADVARAVSFEETPQTASKNVPKNPLGKNSDDTDFQLAGVTLDAGVKIYCSRVDSIHVNAFKMLGGLAHSNPDDIISDPDDEASANNNADPDSTRTRSRGRHRPGRATLEMNLQNITVRKLENDLVADPLFQKMSAAFDEGGASGMLINNLPVGPRGEILFDSADFADSNMQPELEPEGQPDSAEATSECFYSIPNFPHPLEQRDVICPRFLRFFRSKVSADSESSASTMAYGDDSTYTSQETQDSATSTWNQDSTSQSQVEFDYDANDLEQAGDFGVFTAPDDSQSPQNDDDDAVNLFNTSSSRRGSLASASMAIQRGNVDLIEAGLHLNENDEYAFFSKAALSSWAGPIHWRFHASESSTTEAKGKPKKPRGKIAMLLDFSSDASAIDFEKLFEPGKTPQSHQLSASVREGMDEKKVTLPEDLHLSIRWLTGLFLNKRTFVKVRGAAVEHTGDDDDVQVGDNGWYDFDNDGDNDDFPETDLPNSNEAGTDGEVGRSSMGVNLVPEPTRVEAVDINYAKVAKDVDVRALKSGIWSRLCGETGPVQDDSLQMESEQEKEEASTEMKDVRDGCTQNLQDVVRDMEQFVPASSLADVSLSYVFICLLHLANEKELRIEQPPNGNSDVLEDLIISLDQ